MKTYNDGSVTNMWSLNGFIKDLLLPCQRVEKTILSSNQTPTCT